MEELERRRRVDVDAIRDGIKRQEEEKEQRAADADALKRAEAGAKAARYRMWKERRRHVVRCPASFFTSEHRGDGVEAGAHVQLTRHRRRESRRAWRAWSSAGASRPTRAANATDC